MKVANNFILPMSCYFYILYSLLSLSSHGEFGFRDFPILTFFFTETPYIKSATISNSSCGNFLEHFSISRNSKIFSFLGVKLVSMVHFGLGQYCVWTIYLLHYACRSIFFTTLWLFNGAQMRWNDEWVRLFHHYNFLQKTDSDYCIHNPSTLDIHEDFHNYIYSIGCLTISGAVSFVQNTYDPASYHFIQSIMNVKSNCLTFGTLLWYHIFLPVFVKQALTLKSEIACDASVISHG